MKVDGYIVICYVYTLLKVVVVNVSTSVDRLRKVRGDSLPTGVGKCQIATSGRFYVGYRRARLNLSGAVACTGTLVGPIVAI